MRFFRLTILGLSGSLALAACGSASVDSVATAPTTATAGGVASDATTPQAPPTAATISASVAPPPTEAIEVSATTVSGAPTTDAATLNLLDTALESGSFNVLSSLLGSADLIGTLDADGPFTVFAPTDDAFAALPPGLVDALGRPDNHDALVRLLTYHVVAGRLPGASIVAGPLVTLEGSSAQVSAEASAGAALKIDAAKIVTTDLQATNGIIHVLDAVLVPPGLDIAAILSPPTTQVPRPTRTTAAPRGTEAPRTTDAPRSTEPPTPAPTPQPTPAPTQAPAPQPTDAPHST